MSCAHRDRGRCLGCSQDHRPDRTTRRLARRNLGHIRQLIHDADPEILEEWKWEKPSSGGVPVWSHDGIVCTGETYQQVVKLTFARGAAIPDPKPLFNSSLEGNVRRAIDLREGEAIDEAAFRQLIVDAIAVNRAVLAERKSRKK